MTKLTITGRAETILGILQKLEICDAQWNVNEGFTVALDTTDPEADADSNESQPTAKSSPKKPGRKKKEPDQVRKETVKKCQLCGNEFHAKGGNTKYCPECKSMHGNRCAEIEAEIKSGDNND